MRSYTFYCEANGQTIIRKCYLPFNMALRLSNETKGGVRYWPTEVPDDGPSMEWDVVLYEG